MIHSQESDSDDRKLCKYVCVALRNPNATTKQRLAKCSHVNYISRKNSYKTMFVDYFPLSVSLCLCSHAHSPLT